MRKLVLASMSFKAQIKEIVPVLEKAGLTCKVASHGLGGLTISLNNVMQA